MQVWIHRIALFLTGTCLIGTSIAGCDSEQNEYQSARTGIVSVRYDDSTDPKSRLDDPEDTWTTPFPRNDWDCTSSNAERIRDWMEQAHTRSRSLPPIPSEESRIEGPTLASDIGIAIEIGEEAVFVGDRKVGSYAEVTEKPETLEDRVATTLERIRRERSLMPDRSKGDPISIGVIVSPELKGSQVVTIIDIVHSTMEEFEGPLLALFPGTRRDGFEAIPDTLRGSGSIQDDETPSSAAETFLEETRDAIAHCPKLEKDMSAALEAGPRNRDRLLRKSIPEQWHACDCQIDIEYLMLREAFYPHTGHPVTYAPLIETRDGEWGLAVEPNRGISLETDQTWSSIVPERIESEVASLKQAEGEALDSFQIKAP